MTNVMSVKVLTQGFPGQPGYTTLCFADLPIVMPNLDRVQAVRTWLVGLQGIFPAAWSAQIVTPCDIQDVATGELTGVYPVEAAEQVPVPGLAGAGFGAGVAGACVSWYTSPNGIGRPPRGRSFLVPLAQEAWEGNGTLTGSVLGIIGGKSADLVNSGLGFGVWRRPKAKLGGVFFLGISARVSDRAAFLSSRRS